jgi:hypothetical protein
MSPGGQEGSDRVLSEEEAERLWRRAAELQSEAARRAEAAGREGTPPEDETEGPATGGYSLRHVRDAAVEAGIGEDFVRRALVEMESGGLPDTRGAVDSAADLFLGEGPREMVVSRRYAASPRRVFGALQDLIPSDRYPLRLRDARGPHPVEGGVMVFEVPKVDYTKPEGLAYELRAWADIREVHLSLESWREGWTEVVLRAPLGHSRRVNLWVGGGVAAVAGAGGGVGLGAALSAVSAAFLGALAPLAVVATMLGSVTVGLGAATWGWRALYRYALSRGRGMLDEILGDVDLHLRTDGGHLPADGAPRLPGPPE